MSGPALALVLALAASAVPTPSPSPDDETRISLDLKDASIVDLVSLLAEVGGFQVVFDPGISCKLTLKLKEVRWSAAFDTTLRSCRLGQEEENGILRIAPVARLAAEQVERRQYEEERRNSGPRRLATFRLSYARAQEMAPLVKRLLSARGEVVFDARTNTLFVIDQ